MAEQLAEELVATIVEEILVVWMVEEGSLEEGMAVAGILVELTVVEGILAKVEQPVQK